MIKQVLGRTDRLLPFDTTRTAYKNEIGWTQTNNDKITSNDPLPSNNRGRATQTANDLINFLKNWGGGGADRKVTS
jgi:hypothetical protein